MKCPRCDNGNILGTGYILARGCPHCDGTGEIEQGHAWVGTLRTFTCIAVYSERGWMILCGEKMIIEEEFKPTNRMKMVK